MSSEPAAPGALLAALEAISRERPDRVLRLRGRLPGDEGLLEPFELLMFRGFSSLTTHPTAFDPDQPALPEGSRITSAELLQGPLNPSVPAAPLAEPVAVETLLQPEAWC